LILELEIW